MCNLYSHTSNRQAVLDFTKAMTAAPAVGNMPPQTGIYPGYTAPVVRNHEGKRELAMGRWGMPSPASALKGKKVDRGVTNVRNTKSSHWRRWLTVEHLCVVPFKSFSEPGRNADGKSEPVWFAFNEDRPLAFFAGVWTNWTRVRKLKEGEVNADLYGFPTTEPNDLVGAMRPCCTNVMRDSRCESSMIAGRHEQLVPYEVQDQELAFEQQIPEAARFSVDLV